MVIQIIQVIGYTFKYFMVLIIQNYNFGFAKVEINNVHLLFSAVEANQILTYQSKNLKYQPR